MASVDPLLQSVRANADIITLMREAALAELQRSLSIAEKTEASKVQFLACISHELRTPLNAIIGFSDMILSGHVGPVENARHQEYLKLIQASAQHLQGLIESMLGAVKIEIGKATLNVESIDVLDFCRQCVLLVRPISEACSIRIAGEGDRVSDAQLRQDPVRFRQILLNLLRNAIEHAPEGTAVDLKVAVDGPLADGYAAGVTVSVTDLGPGIPADRQVELFKPFCQLEDAWTRTTGGLGLGLSISKSLAELMGGSIGCRSTPGAQTEFWFHLPDRGQS